MDLVGKCISLDFVHLGISVDRAVCDIQWTRGVEVF